MSSRTVDRFDLEDSIMNVWRIVDDLRILVVNDESCDSIELKARVEKICSYYSLHFEDLSRVFEALISRLDVQCNVKKEFFITTNYIDDHKE